MSWYDAKVVTAGIQKRTTSTDTVERTTFGHQEVGIVRMGKGEKMKTNYLTLEIPENLAKMWFRGVGAEIVVHCKDCKHWRKEKDGGDYGHCKRYDHYARVDCYCSEGERREK